MSIHPSVLPFSHMSRGIPETGVVRVGVILFHVFLIGDSRDEDPEAGKDDHSFPQGIGDIVPHLLVEQMDLLQSSDVVLHAGGVAHRPHSEVVHVSHVGPGVLEFHAVLQYFVFEDVVF